jgi:hypothetical protein
METVVRLLAGGIPRWADLTQDRVDAVWAAVRAEHDAARNPAAWRTAPILVRGTTNMGL